jgi:2'-5' RNA ligase
MRLFIAIDLPPALSGTLLRATRTLITPEAQHRARITFTRPENLHLTLSFLGQVAPSRLDEIERALATIKAPWFHIHLEGAGSFASAGILYAAVKASATLLSFVEQIFQSMEHCGFARERRPFMPHITLARGKGRLHLPREADNAAFHKSFEAHEFRLYESLTKPQGAQYEIHKAFPLI